MIKKQKKGFTLIEVLISVIILTFAIGSILSIKQDSLKWLKIADKQTDDLWISVSLSLFAKKNDDKRDIHLYTLLSNNLTINDDDIRKFLKDIKVKYTHTLTLTKDFKKEYGLNLPNIYIYQDSFVSDKFKANPLVRIEKE